MLQDRHIGSLGSGMPMFYGATGVEGKWKFAIGLFRKWLPVGADEFGFAIFGRKDTIGVETLRGKVSAACGKRPLQSAMVFN